MTFGFDIIEFTENFFYKKQPTHLFHPSDVVEIDFKERTFVPTDIQNMHGERGVIEQVLVGYDLYETKECIECINNTLIVSYPLPDLPKNEVCQLQLNIWTNEELYCETIIPDDLYKIISINQETNETNTCYYKKRSYIYHKMAEDPHFKDRRE